MDLRQHLTDIYQRRGKLTPAIVVDEARPSGAPLHDRFEWDDRRAGENYRQVQACEIIRSVKIRYAEHPREQPREVRAFVRQDTDSREPFNYAPIEIVLSNNLDRARLLKDMRRDWECFKKRYEQLQEFAELISSYTHDAA